MIPIKVLPVKDPENIEAQEILSVRRKMDRTQNREGNALLKKGTLSHLRTQSVSEILHEPSSSALNIYNELFDDKKKIKGEYLRKSKIKDMNMLEGVHDE